MTATKRTSPAAIIAATFSCDVADVRDFRYQPTRTARAVYAISDRYYTVSATKPNVPGFDWHAHADQFFAQQAGTILWVANADEEVGA